MAKTDDIIKNELTSIGHYKNLKMRGFVGSSNYDQELWVDGGLTFRYGGHAYGSCDFAWYREEKWVEPSTGKEYKYKPIIAVEGTDCLNTKSYGTAQIQRFHHCLGSFLNGIISVYYLKEGKHPIRHDLLLAAYYCNFVHDYKNTRRAYLITDRLDDINKLVHLIGDYGEDDSRVWNHIDAMLNRMLSLFNDFYDGYKTFDDYLHDRCIYKCGDKFIKYLGPKKESFLDSQIRYGHIVLGEAYVCHYILLGKKLIQPGDKYFYLFPLINDDDYSILKTTMTHDKEFALLSRSDADWNILTIDHIEFKNPELKSRIEPFKKLNLNDHRKEWNVVRKEISKELICKSFKLI